MTKTEKILKLLEDNGLSVYDLTMAYWTLHLEDYIARCTDFEDLELTDEQEQEIIDDVHSDDEMWNKIDDTIDYFIRHDVKLIYYVVYRDNKGNETIQEDSEGNTEFEDKDYAEDLCCLWNERDTDCNGEYVVKERGK